MATIVIVHFSMFALKFCDVVVWGQIVIIGLYEAVKWRLEYAALDVYFPQMNYKLTTCNYYYIQQ